VALYICSHRGHTEAVRYLLAQGNSARKLSVFELGTTKCLVFLYSSLVIHHTWSLPESHLGEYPRTGQVSRRFCLESEIVGHCDIGAATGFPGLFFLTRFTAGNPQAVCVSSAPLKVSSVVVQHG
jgi:hypothetical protein